MAGWVSARALQLHPGVSAMRTLVVIQDYVVDELMWYSRESVVMDLPIHLDSDELGGDLGPFGDRLEDTFGALENVSSHVLPMRGTARLTARDGGRTLHAFLTASSSGVLYRSS